MSGHIYAVDMHESAERSLHTSQGVKREHHRTPFSCSGCARVWFRLGYSHCGECHSTFASTQAGDAHRVGPHDGQRRCLGVGEMGLRKKPQLEEFMSDGLPVWRVKRKGK